MYSNCLQCTRISPILGYSEYQLVAPFLEYYANVHNLGYDCNQTGTHPNIEHILKRDINITCGHRTDLLTHMYLHTCIHKNETKPFFLNCHFWISN